MIKKYQNLVHQLGLFNLPKIDDNGSIWLISIPVKVVSFVENFLPPISYRSLINYFLI